MRVNIILAVAALVLGYITCKNFQKTSDASSAPAPAATTPPSAAPPKPHYTTIPVDRPGLAPTASRKAYLATGYWSITTAVTSNDSTLRPQYESKWFQFREDMTFDILAKGKPKVSGRWNFDEKREELYLSCEDAYLNNTWKVIGNGFSMVWIGNTAYNSSGYQLRINNFKELPPLE